jgi:hypothetical protein
MWTEHFTEVVTQARLDKIYGQVCDVDAHPRTVQLLCDSEGSAASAERVKHNVAFIGTGFDDAFEQCFRLLRGIAKAFSSSCNNWSQVRPNILKWDFRHFVQVSLVFRQCHRRCGEAVPQQQTASCSPWSKPSTVRCTVEPRRIPTRLSD